LDVDEHQRDHREIVSVEHPAGERRDECPPSVTHFRRGYGRSTFAEASKDVLAVML
jgi:hypothetical protein